MRRFYSLCVLLSIMILFLSGCGKEDVFGTEISGNENVYLIDSIHLPIGVDMLPIPSSFCLEEKKLFFLSQEGNAYKLDLDQGVVPEKLEVYLQEDYRPVTVFQNSDGAPSIFAATNNGKGMIVSWDGTAFSKKFAEFEIELSDAVIRNVIQAADGLFYISCGTEIVVCNQDGSYVKSIKSEQEIVDIGMDKEGTVYATCFVNDMDTMLMKVNIKDKRLDAGVIIPGNGKLFSGVNEGCKFIDGTSIYALEDNVQYRKLVDLSQEGISPYSIQCMGEGESGQIDLITWVSYMGDPAQNPIEWVHMKPSTKEERQKQEQDKVKLHVLTLSQGSLDAVVTDFNKKSNQIRVELINLDYSDAKDIELFVNTRLMGKDAPDILIMESFYYPIYRKANILADLSEYIKDSQILNRNRFVGSVLAPFEEKDTIYVLPQSFYIRTLVGRDVASKESMSTDGLSIDDFVQMVASTSNLKMEYGGGTIGLLEFCLELGMERFVDFEQRSCNFDGDEFRELVEVLETISVESDFSQSEWKEVAQGENPILATAVLSDYESFGNLTKLYGPQLGILGFPTGVGDYHTKLLPNNMIGILKTSKEKEAAVEFLEFFMENQWPNGFPALQDKLKEAESKVSKEQSKLGTLEETNMAIIHSVYVEDQMHLAIKDIIFEELQYYLNHEKQLEEVLDIIQSRVSLFLMET